jgi:predicted dienelactone hydrolase
MPGFALRISIAATLVSLAPCTVRAQDLYKSTDGPYNVRTLDHTWKDEARKNREIPVHIYIPEPKPADYATDPAKPKAPQRFPVIIFSHGLGGAGTNYAYFGQHLASHGYLVLAPTHAGSDTAALKQWIKARFTRTAHPKGGGEDNKPDPAEVQKQESGWLMSSINDPDNLRNRPLDISYLITQLSTDSMLSKLADTAHIGVAGHSFGAYTAMTIGGMTVDLPDDKGRSFRDHRVAAILPMSPEGPGAMGISQGAWEKFAAPVMFLTGTRDYGVGERSADWRRAGFENVKSVDDYLITLNGAGHMTFADPGGEGAEPGGKLRARIRERVNEKAGGGKDDDQPHHVDMIKSLSTAFFDAYLRKDAAAKDWLVKFSMAKHGDCVAEFKPATPSKPQ